MQRLTRILVLAGVVTLANTFGCMTNPADQLLEVEPKEAQPISPAVNNPVQATSDFGIDLYQQLARENQGKNLFFSPYSMSVALTMTAEGARQETAAEMGKVLRFPATTHQTGAAAALQPWNITPIHRGMQELLTRYNPRPVSAAQAAQLEAKRAQFALEKAELDRLKQLVDKDYSKWQTAYGVQREKTEKPRHELNALLEKINPYELRVANRLYGEKTYPFQHSYLDTINQYYGSGTLDPVDFIHDAELMRKRINAWVQKQTNERIKVLLPANSLDEMTRLVLVNAVYFKGDWLAPFDARDTKKEDFLTATGKAPVSMMSSYKLEGTRYGAFNADGSFFATPELIYRESSEQDLKKAYPGKDGFLVAELSYKGRELSMLVIVPQDAQGLAELEKKLSSDQLQNWIGKLENRNVHVQLPKFKMETDYPEMSHSLETLGMVRAFVNPQDPARGAQFDGMCASTDPRLKLYISKVCHKAFVEVNEKGTEAAAATAVVMREPVSLPSSQPFTPTFRADKPFIFAIRDVQLGTILFLGRLVNPKE